ncbi:MAG: aldo/keto reductase [Phycisphaerales bacterium]|nr:MAG: aldo/keto reductase [Phycisphaerales bacterium]
MQYRQLGQSGVEVSEISLGCWTLGGLNWVDGVPNGWADVDDNECIRAIQRAIDAGVNHFDNADCYGNGRAERLLAQALGERRQNVVIASKVGHFCGTAQHAYEALHVRHQCEQSLKNLRTDHLDVYYFHHGDFGPDDCYLDEALETFHRLQEEGKIRLVGLSAYSADDFRRLVPKIRPTVLQSWAHLMDDQFIRPGGPVAQLLAERHMSFVAFSPLAQGLLLGKYDPDKPPQFEAGDFRSERDRFSTESIRKVNAQVDQVKQRFGASAEQLARVALQYVLAHDNIACVIPGFRNTRQVVCNVSAAGKPLGAEEVGFLRGVFLEK